MINLLVVLILPNCLAPVLFAGVLQFRNAMMKIAGGKKQAVVLFAVLQVLITIARFFAVTSYIDVEDWGTFSFPYPFLGKILVGLGVALNLLVYYRLGIYGVYYGSAFGIDMPWCTQWPYGRYGIPHPQYYGVMLQSVGVALQHQTNFAIAFCIVTAISYVIIVKVEQFYFGKIDADRRKKTAQNGNKKK